MDKIKIFQLIFNNIDFKQPILIAVWISIFIMCILFLAHIWKIFKGQYSKFPWFEVSDLKKT